MTPAFNVTFGEATPTTFKAQGNPTLNALFNSSSLFQWVANNTETGYFVTGLDASQNTVTSVANSATRIKIVFNNLPTGTTIFVPVNLNTNELVSAAPAGTATLTQTETGAFSAVPPTLSPPAGYTGTAQLGQLGITAGTATAIYEVTGQNSSTLESYTIPVYLAAFTNTVTALVNGVTATPSLAPVNAASNIPGFTNVGSTTLNGTRFDYCVTPGTMPSGITGVSYSQSLIASGGTAPYNFTEAVNPGGLTLSSTGTLSGFPTTIGTNTFNYTVTDAKRNCSQRFLQPPDYCGASGH